MDARGGTAAHTSLWWGRHGRPAEPWERPHEVTLPSSGERHAVAVVGAGLTGLTTAVLLARAGVQPLVLEARYPGAGTTGHSTAKVSLLQGSVYSGIRSHHGDAAVRAYAEAGRAGQAWLLDFCTAAGVPVQRRDAWTYATTPEGARQVATEHEACATAGLLVQATRETELPFRVEAALRLPEQAQLDPLDVVFALRAELERLGGTVVEGVGVTGVSVPGGAPAGGAAAGGAAAGGAAAGGAPCTLDTSHGDVLADRVVVASGFPVLDRGLYFAQLQPSRSYAQAYRLPGRGGITPQGMYLSVDRPTRSLRTAPGSPGSGTDELLLVGGNNHVVGRKRPTRECLADLGRWTATAFPGAELVYEWAAQDYRSTGHIPVVGPMARSGDRVYLATGYNKWGLTTSVAAALMLAADLVGGGASEELAWAAPFRSRPPTPRDLATSLEVNGTVGLRMAADWVRQAVPGGGGRTPAEGEGFVEHGTFPPVATATVDGRTYRVDAVCPHLKGILAWNDADRSWDCPLHGSRFSADGHRLEGPATSDLAPR